MNALEVALNELGDGAALVWKRQKGLAGVIKPVAAFRDDQGRVCRHLIYSLSFGNYAAKLRALPAAAATAGGRCKAEFQGKSLPARDAVL